MNISIGSNSSYVTAANFIDTSSKTNSLETKLKSGTTNDEELMEACKSFETYMLEQVFKGMEKTVMKDEENKENDYMAQFGDKLYEEYAQAVTESQSVGLAQILYESMKRNV